MKKILMILMMALTVPMAMAAETGIDPAVEKVLGR